MTQQLLLYFEPLTEDKCAMIRLWCTSRKMHESKASGIELSSPTETGTKTTLRRCRLLCLAGSRNPSQCFLGLAAFCIVHCLLARGTWLTHHPSLLALTQSSSCLQLRWIPVNLPRTYWRPLTSPPREGPDVGWKGSHTDAQCLSRFSCVPSFLLLTVDQHPPDSAATALPFVICLQIHSRSWHSPAPHVIAHKSSSYSINYMDVTYSDTT